MEKETDYTHYKEATKPTMSLPDSMPLALRRIFRMIIATIQTD